MTLRAAHEHSSILAASARPHRRLRSILLVAALALVVGGYLGFVRKYCSPYASGSDSSGYLNSARLLSRGELITSLPRIEGLQPPEWNYYFQQSLGFEVDRKLGTTAPTYPVGYPLHLILASLFVDLDYATILVNIALAAAAAGLMVALGRHFGLPWTWALASAGLLWACPLFIFFILQPMTDVCATVWTLAALCAALKSREHWVWGFAAGLAFAVGVLVRPSNLLIIFPVAFAVGLNLRAWLALGFGGLPGAAFLAWYNLKLYGAALTTGYGNVESLFAFRFVPHNAGHFAFWLCVLLSPFVFLPSFGLPALFRDARSSATLLLLWVATVLGFYVFYFHSGESWWYLRFILPMFPAIIFAALLVSYRELRRLPATRWAKWVPVLLLVGALSWEITTTHRFFITLTKHSEHDYPRAAEWMKANAPANAIVLQMQLSGSFTYYTPFTIVRWDLLDSEAWNRLRVAARAAGRPIYATLFDFEAQRAFPNYLSGQWNRVSQISQVSIWRLVEPASIPPQS